MKNVSALGLSLVCTAGLSTAVLASPEPAPVGEDQQVTDYFEKPEMREVAVSIDSGVVRVTEPDARAKARALQVPVWSEVVEAEDADWLRLFFSDVVLARSTEDVRESYLRITSLHDGHEQYLDMNSLKQWDNSTAYFNGNAVRVEIMASPNATDQYNRVRIDQVQMSDPVSGRSICFSVDDRELSDDPRDARLMPVGCTAWLFGDHGSRMMTASHCGPSGGNVIQFNVPLSTGGGSPQNPPPQDQYPIDGSSVQQSASVFIGNDWAYFGVFDNSNTGMSPGQSYGDGHNLAASVPPVDGRPIRITGYGSTTSPVPASWYLVQKTHVGPLMSFSGNTVRYQTDTTGGNSGSAILDENNNEVLGIHTNAGCNSGGGSNQGTSLFNSGLQDALANPRGICLPRGIQASLLFEPTHIDPDGGDTVTLVIDNLQGHTVSGTPTMYVSGPGGFVAYPMAESGPMAYDGTFGSYYCGDDVQFYFEIEDNEGDLVTVPEIGTFSTVALDDLDVRFDDDFETNQGWSVSGNSADGQWQRGVPVNCDRGDPGSDFDGSGQAYVTDNSAAGACNSDVDDGSTILTSPVMDASQGDTYISYARWFSNDFGALPMTEVFEVEVSDDAGASWVNLETVGPTGSEVSGGWFHKQFDLNEVPGFVPNDQFRIRFIATDTINNGSVIEAGVDAVELVSFVCSEDACPADFNGDGNTDFFDISGFLKAFNAGDPDGDFNGDGNTDFFDVSGFLKAFNAGCP